MAFFDRGGGFFDQLAAVEQQGLSPERGGRIHSAQREHAAREHAGFRVLALREPPPLPGEDWEPGYAYDEGCEELNGADVMTRALVADLAADVDPHGSPWVHAVRTARDDAWASAASLREQIDFERGRQKAEACESAGLSYECQGEHVRGRGTVPAMSGGVESTRERQLRGRGMVAERSHGPSQQVSSLLSDGAVDAPPTSPSVRRPQYAWARAHIEASEQGLLGGPADAPPGSRSRAAGAVGDDDLVRVDGSAGCVSSFQHRPRSARPTLGGRESSAHSKKAGPRAKKTGQCSALAGGTSGAVSHLIGSGTPRDQACCAAESGAAGSRSHISETARGWDAQLSGSAREATCAAVSACAPDFMHPRSPVTESARVRSVQEAGSAGRRSPGRDRVRSPALMLEHAGGGAGRAPGLAGISAGAPEFMQRPGQPEPEPVDPHGGELLRMRGVLDERGRCLHNGANSEAAPAFMHCSARPETGGGHAAGRAGVRTFASADASGTASEGAAGRRPHGAGMAAHASFVSASAPEHMQRSLEQAARERAEGSEPFARVQAQMHQSHVRAAATEATRSRGGAHGKTATVVSANAPDFVKGPLARAAVGCSAEAEWAPVDGQSEPARGKGAARPGVHNTASADAPSFFCGARPPSLGASSPGPDADQSEAIRSAQASGPAKPRARRPRGEQPPVEGSAPSLDRARVLSQRSRKHGALSRSDGMSHALGGQSRQAPPPAASRGNGQEAVGQAQQPRDISLLLSGLPARTDEAQLAQHLRRLNIPGEVHSVRLRTDLMTGDALDAVISVRTSSKQPSSAPELAASLRGQTKLKASPL